MLLLPCLIGSSVDGLFSYEGLLSSDGQVSVEGRPPELLMGLEKLKEGRCNCEPLIEYSEVMLGER